MLFGLLRAMPHLCFNFYDYVAATSKASHYDMIGDTHYYFLVDQVLLREGK